MISPIQMLRVEIPHCRQVKWYD